MKGVVDREACYAIPCMDKDAINRMSVHDVAKVTDSMRGHGALHNSIKPAMIDMKLCGQAVTVYAPVGSYETVLEAAAMLKPGNVLVVAAQGVCNYFMADRVLYAMLKKAGASGLLVDGAVTDINVAKAENLPVFSRCLSARYAEASEKGAINVPVYCGDMLIIPGDYIIGDADGAAAIPGQDIWRVIELADAHLLGELSRLERTNNGETLASTSGCIARTDAWKD